MSEIDATEMDHFEGLTSEQVKARVYGYAEDLADDKMSVSQLANVVAMAAERLDGGQRKSLEGILRLKVDREVVDEVVAPLQAPRK